MNGAHDMGGMHGFGKVVDEPEDVRFHGDWEKRAFALTLACGGLKQWTIDEGRYARERQDPAQYLGNTYYEQWLHGLELLLLEKGIVTEEELRAGKALEPKRADLNYVEADQVNRILQQGSPYTREVDAAPAFAIGDKVCVWTSSPATHTRAPRYVRGKVGTVVMHHGAHVYADTSALGDHPIAHHLYNVAFEAEELWGADAQGGQVHLDLWEPYLSRV